MFGAIAFATVFQSCTDLEPEVYGDIVTEAPGSELPLLEDPEGVLLATYNGLQTFTDQAGAFSLLEHTSDELIGPTRGTDWFDAGAWQQMHAHNWTASNPRVIETFTRLSTPYFNATQVIAATSDADIIAEAKFLRAYFMAHMADFYGQVPFREATEGIGVFPKVLSRAEAIAFVIQDLEEAIPALQDFDPTDAGAVNKQAAQVFLTRMLLNKAVYSAASPEGPYAHAPADLDRVVSLSNDVIASGYFQLQAPGSYFQMFGPDNTAQSTESVLALQFANGDGIGSSTQNRHRMTTHYNQEISGWNGFTTVADFYNKWDQADERFSAEGLNPDAGLRAGFLEGQQFGKDAMGETVALTTRSGQPLVFTVDVSLGFSNEAAGVRVLKYYPDLANIEDPANDYVLLRYAEVFLNKAEAQLRNGDNGGALATINELRASREGAAALPSLDEPSLLDERGFEMYWEGVRRLDQVRFGTYLSSYSEKEYESDPRVFLFPIPLEQIAANPNLVQNAGY